MSEPPKPLYDKDSNLSAWWIGEHIYTLNLDWIAFVQEGHAFSARVETVWLGPAREGLLLDRSGHVILWTPGVNVSGDVTMYRPARAYRPPRPERPPRPNLPPRPYKPARPSNGWSEMELRVWITGGPEQVAPVQHNAGMSPNEIEFDDE